MRAPRMTPRQLKFGIAVVKIVDASFKIRDPHIKLLDAEVENHNASLKL